MKLASGIDYDTKLKPKSPWGRFDYIRRTLIKAIKKLSAPYQHLELNQVRAKLGLTVQRFSELKADKLMTIDIAKELAEIINSDLEVLTTDHDSIFKKPEPKPKRVRKKKIPPTSTAPSSAPAKPSSGKEFTFINQCPFHLSLDIKGRTISIWENAEAPNSAKHALIGKDTVMVSGKEVDRTTPSKIKVG